MRVLITGGFGCIGSWICKQLIERKDQVWIYDLRKDLHRLELILNRAQLEKVNFVQGDVTDLSGVMQCTNQNQISHIIHLAGLQVPVCRTNPILGANVNVIGTLCMFEAAQKTATVERVVYASSGAVFGPPEQYETVPIPDDVKLVPSTHYGAFKVCNESNARVYWQDHEISSIGLRPWTVYGVGRDFGMTSMPTKAIKALVVGRKFHINYGGVQDMQYVEDVAGTFVRCCDAEFHGAATYNIRGQVVDLATICRTMAEVDPSAAELISHGDSQLPIAFDLSDEKICAEIGQIPKTSLLEGIQRTYDQFRALKEQDRLDLSELDD